MYKPAAVRRESWVMNPAISSKVIVNMTQDGSAAEAVVKAAAPPEKESKRSQPELEGASEMDQAAESATPPSEVAPWPAAPAAAAKGKRKASAGETWGFQQKKSTPVGQ